MTIEFINFLARWGHVLFGNLSAPVHSMTVMLDHSKGLQSAKHNLESPKLVFARLVVG